MEMKMTMAMAPAGNEECSEKENVTEEFGRLLDILQGDLRNRIQRTVPECHEQVADIRAIADLLDLSFSELDAFQKKKHRGNHERKRA